MLHKYYTDFPSVSPLQCLLCDGLVTVLFHQETMKKKGGDDARGDVITEGEVAGEDLLERKTRERLEEFTKKLE